MYIRSITIKFFRRCLWFLYHVYYAIYETFHSQYTIITASVEPLKNNWGDDASVILCKLINPDMRFIVNRYTWNVKGRDDILCIGSIITWMTTPKSTIWGSGIVYPNNEIVAKPQKVLAVRGPLTREYLLKRGIDCPEIYGDPALLFPRYYSPSCKKKYKLGIIPHFRDRNNPLLEKYRNCDSVIIIDVQHTKPWTRFIDEIVSCEFIASSSLHGIIISDAYHVANTWVTFPSGERKEFAFHDYLYSVGKEDSLAIGLSESTTVDDIIGFCKRWKPINIDLDKLLAVCPFKE